LVTVFFPFSFVCINLKENNSQLDHP
jgi:hypothetical protein